MLKENKSSKNRVEQVPQTQTAGETDVWTPGQKEEKPVPFVVIRGGMRVSDTTYDDPNDPKAIDEATFWQNVVDRHPDGTKVEIVSYDKKKHRVW